MAQDGSNGEMDSEIEMEGTIENGVDNSIRLVERLLQTWCKRVILDGFMDGRDDRDGCEERVEKCEGL